MFETFHVFFRDDDADRDLPQLRQLIDLFTIHEAPLSLAVIPGTLTGDGARLLADLPPSFELHQHGWMHANHETQGRKCEFGPSRGYAEQRRDIEQGRDRLESLLGAGRVAPVFTPPWNRCTVDTVRALTDLGFAALSKDRSTALGMPEISISVDLFTWKNGPSLKPMSQLTTEISAHREASASPLGILLHHKVMTSEAFDYTAQLLDMFRPVARFHTLESACRLNNN